MKLALRLFPIVLMLNVNHLHFYMREFEKFARKHSNRITSISDGELDYFRDRKSFRSFVPFIEHYLEQIDKGRQVNEIAADFPPIRIDVEFTGKKYLNDGRHRFTAAQAFGATRIPAIVIYYNENYDQEREDQLMLILEEPISEMAAELRRLLLD